MVDIKKFKHLWKFFALLFLICLLIFNWNKLNKILIFSNYKVIEHRFDGLFKQPAMPFPTSTAITFVENKIEIPKIKIVAPIVFGEKNSEKKETKQQLKKGVLLYPESLPGQKGKAIILGHSAPVGWPDIDYDNVFSNLNQLENKDEVIVYFEQKKYIYEVFNKKIFLPQDEEQALVTQDKNQFILILLTCWPPGKDHQRLGVLTKLKQ
ncbi:sortase [Patescibacteria group bacterium]|nr:sortase [Patescibacteria group bacterium]